ncbi:helix-turn-helix domain-containing protein [Agathobaculum desmolans]|uniref:helix-turn-helix domain-containing protein n=1 Tax=Agathobaculum desmolans TaxID=39484 RepID=UPI00068E54B3|nr:helix-turn-helix transcriptional regulator [Agathobaculum desmolans]
MNRIKELRQKKGLSVRKAAEEIGISQSMLSSYENGTRAPRDDETWGRLANYFGVSISYLMGLTDKLHIPETDSGHFHPPFVYLDTGWVQREYIDTQKPVEIFIHSPAEYALLANVVQLDRDGVSALLGMVQHMIQQEGLGRKTEIRLPD